MTPSSDRPQGRRVPMIVVPLLAYLGVTVLVPLMNGLVRHEEFWEHALTASIVPSIMTVIWFGFRRVVAPSPEPPEARGGKGSKLK